MIGWQRQKRRREGRDRRRSPGTEERSWRGRTADGMGWLDLEDLWTHQMICMKLSIEEIKRKQKHRPPPTPSYWGEWEKKEQRKEKREGLTEQEGSEWTVLVYPKKGGLLRKRGLLKRGLIQECPQEREWAKCSVPW